MFDFGDFHANILPLKQSRGHDDLHCPQLGACAWAVAGETEKPRNLWKKRYKKAMCALAAPNLVKKRDVGENQHNHY